MRASLAAGTITPYLPDPATQAHLEALSSPERRRQQQQEVRSAGSRAGGDTAPRDPSPIDPPPDEMLLPFDQGGSAAQPSE